MSTMYQWIADVHCDFGSSGISDNVFAFLDDSYGDESDVFYDWLLREGCDTAWLGCLAFAFCDDEEKFESQFGWTRDSLRAFCDGGRELADGGFRIYYHASDGCVRFFEQLKKSFPGISAIDLCADGDDGITAVEIGRDFHITM